MESSVKEWLALEEADEAVPNGEMCLCKFKGFERPFFCLKNMSHNTYCPLDTNFLYLQQEPPQLVLRIFPYPENKLQKD